MYRVTIAFPSAHSTTPWTVFVPAAFRLQRPDLSEAMGKKTRTGTGRRTILQLSPPGPRSVIGGGAICREEALGSASEDEQEGIGDSHIHSIPKEVMVDRRTPAVKATEGLSLLGAYEDSEEEEEEMASQPAPAKPKHNQSADIDSTLANFMAEIDAITTQPAQLSDEPSANPPPPTPPRPNPKDHQHASAPVELGLGTEFQYNTQCSLAGVGVEMGDWQEVWDENTGCYYYWNTQTNEVAWELPHYLAHQVQGLQQYTDSLTTAVNGNGSMQSSTFYMGQHPAAGTASTSMPASVKEPKKKEVMESVVALMSEEEESRGVAASLLAPLIPPEVKVAEEKWRKSALGILEEASEGRLDSESESGCPPTPPPPGDTEASVQGDLRSRTQSAESSEGDEAEMEEVEEDTVELELALERKKAELRALEEGDGSAGGSSPCSEASQEGARGTVLKKSKWKTAFLRAPSPDSNSHGSAKTGRDTPEHVDAVDSKTPEKPGKEELMETDTSVEKAKLRASSNEEETADLKFQIGELANTLTSKMEFLGINKKAISNFQLLLLQTETRITDWREGALNGHYLRRRLQEAAEHIKHYELNAAPKGWSCHWDREHRRYFYVNDRTSASQWDFPAEGDGEEKMGEPVDVQGDAKPPPEPPTAPPVYTSTPSLQTGMQSYCTLPQPPLPPDDPPPPSDYPPPPPPPPESPPPPPPPPLSDDGEIEEVEMEDEEGEPPAPGTEEDGSRKAPAPPGMSAGKGGESASSPGMPTKAPKRKAAGSGQPHKAVTIGSSPILYSQATAMAAVPGISAPAYWSMVASAPPQPPAETTALPVVAPPSQPAPPSAPQDPVPGKVVPVDKVKKLKKDKTKKSKTKMPSLVKKWQSIQRELDEEEKSSSSDEDRDQVNSKRIEEWKQQQLTSGKSVKNANFEALPDDWRERLLKKRKMMHST
uniref:Formin binding protein 4 n=1 Tax=Paramormyrops kingsleyae TaxID=1676925 RepID=A0A3B3SUB3_9TELE|nr:formin-binding protein 4 isoform X1 [Paramormyrops kingsleyae]